MACSIVNLRDEGKSSRKHLSKACPFCNKHIKIPLPLSNIPPVEAYNHIKDIILQLKRVWDDKFVHNVEEDVDVFQRYVQDTILLEESDFQRLPSTINHSSFTSLFSKTLPEIQWNDYLTLYLACIQVLQNRIQPLTAIQLYTTSHQKKSEKITIGDWILFQRDAISNNELSPERFISLLDSIILSNPIFKDLHLFPHQLSCLHDYIHKTFQRPLDKERSADDSSLSIGGMKSDLITAIRHGELPKFMKKYRFHSYFATMEMMQFHEKSICSMIAEAFDVSHLFKATKQMHSFNEDKRRAQMLVKSQFKTLCYIFHPYVEVSAEAGDEPMSSIASHGSHQEALMNGASELGAGVDNEVHGLAPSIVSAVVVSESDSSGEGARQSSPEEFIIPKKPKRNMYVSNTLHVGLIHECEEEKRWRLFRAK